MEKRKRHELPPDMQKMSEEEFNEFSRDLWVKVFQEVIDPETSDEDRQYYTDLCDRMIEESTRRVEIAEAVLKIQRNSPDIPQA